MSEEALITRSKEFEVDCLQVNKVFDACSTRVCETFDFNPAVANTSCGESGTVAFGSIASIISCEGLDNAEVKGIIHSRTGTPIADVKAWIVGFVRILVRTTSGTTVELIREVKFQVRVLLFAPRPMRMTVGGEALIRCLGCILVPEAHRIRCSVGAFVIIKTLGLVELRVPVFGLCPVPEECTVLAEATACEVFLNQELTRFPNIQDFFPRQQRTDDC